MFQPIPPVYNPISAHVSPPASAIENAAWEVDWTMHGDDILTNIPQGVNTVNVFVGGFDAQNNYQIDFRSDLDKLIPPSSHFYDPNDPTTTYLQKFVAECHRNGIAVKISLGGNSAGWCGHCWDALKIQGIQTCANTLVNFCKTNLLDGVDFEFEEWNQPDQAALEQSVGTLIKQVKAQEPTLQTSLCTNASFPAWQSQMKNILDAAQIASGGSSVDRLYIMSYYDPLQTEEGWVCQWAVWLKANYQFTPAQISVGLDNVDSSANDIKQFAEWAKSEGYSTCYWAWGWDGSNPTKSNDSTNEIWSIYHPPKD